MEMLHLDNIQPKTGYSLDTIVSVPLALEYHRLLVPKSKKALSEKIE